MDCRWFYVGPDQWSCDACGGGYSGGYAAPMFCLMDASNEEESQTMDEEPNHAKPYWMVHCEATGPARMKHHSRKSAEDEAVRLARNHPGHTFFVLETVSARFLRDPVERIDFDNPEPPF